MSVPAEQVPCKEVVLTGDQVDILRFPFIQSNPADAGRYVNTGNVLLVDPEHGRNVATYRCQVKGPRKLGVNPEPQQHGWTFLMDMQKRGETVAKAAIVLGADPIVYAMSSSKTARLGQDELTIAGGFMGKPVEVVQCETCDLMVPANAEMVIKGEIPLNDMEEEGPFGEMYGYMGLKRPENFYMNITALTHRRNPWFVNQFTGVTRGFLTAPMEATANLGFKRMIPSLIGIHLPVELTGFCFVSIDKQKPGEGLAAGRSLVKILSIAKIIVVVDKSVDILNSTEVLHAVGARWQPHPAGEIIPESPGMRLDPSTCNKEVSSKIIIDATRQLPEEGGPDTYPLLNRECLTNHRPDIFEHIDNKWADFLQGRQG